MIKKTRKNLVILLLCTFIISMFCNTKVYASIADEAEDYTLGTTFKGNIDGYDGRYYKFEINKKSYVSLKTVCSINSGFNKLTFQIYSSDGKVVLRRDDVIEQYNSVNDQYTGSNSRILDKGLYYLFVFSGDDKTNWYANANFEFNIQAEPLISLSKGKISILKSSKKGQMTVKCATDSEAIGYRIQYATDEKFSKNKKTVYIDSPQKVISGLKRGRRYYVKVCPYAVYDDGTRVFGQNSLVKTVVIK